VYLWLSMDAGSEPAPINSTDKVLVRFRGLPGGCRGQEAVKKLTIASQKMGFGGGADADRLQT
jgi:hypothetical protein